MDDRLATILRRFRDFAEEFAHLPLYGALARRLAQDREAAALLLEAQPGQDRPVLWFAAVHDLVLRRPDLPAARWYASVVERDSVPVGDPWPDVRATALAHREELAGLIATRLTQTNEVNRSVYLAAGLVAATHDQHPGTDNAITLVELGASAGLLLGVDRYAIAVDRQGVQAVAGDPLSPVRCEGTDRSPVAVRLDELPRIAGRAGVDRNPIRLDDDAGLRWLTACLWPDVPGRVERFRAAVELMRREPPPVVQGDFVDGLEKAVAAALGPAASTSHLVVFSSWALTYADRARRSELADRLDALAREVPALSWLTAEPPGAIPGIPVPRGVREDAGGTVLGLRQWRDGVEQEGLALGTCHPHGEWIDLDEMPSG